MFQELGSYESFNIIDDILIEEAIKNGQSQGALMELRENIEKRYVMGLIDVEDGEEIYIPGNYAAQTENGYEGFLPPMG